MKVDIKELKPFVELPARSTFIHKEFLFMKIESYKNVNCVNLVDGSLWNFLADDMCFPISVKVVNDECHEEIACCINFS